MTRWAVAALLQAEGLTEVQDDFLERWEWTEQYGIFMDDVSELVRATDDRDYTLVLFAGQFDWEDIIDDLEDAGFRDDTYRNVEIWEDRQGGVVVGLLGAGVATRFLEVLLFGVGANDPATFATVAVAVILVGGVAALVPSVRATRVDPLVALQREA